MIGVCSGGLLILVRFLVKEVHYRLSLVAHCLQVLLLRCKLLYSCWLPLPKRDALRLHQLSFLLLAFLRESLLCGGWSLDDFATRPIKASSITTSTHVFQRSD